MSLLKPSLVVHIGQHKTGSKALQSFLAHNRIALRDRGVLYPAGNYPCAGIRAYAISQYRLYALIRHEAIRECLGGDAAAFYWRQQGRFCIPFDSARCLFEAIDAELRRFNLGQVVVSAEDLFDMHTAHEPPFCPSSSRWGLADSPNLHRTSVTMPASRSICAARTTCSALITYSSSRAVPSMMLTSKCSPRRSPPGLTRVGSSPGGRMYLDPTGCSCAATSRPPYRAESSPTSSSMCWGSPSRPTACNRLPTPSRSTGRSTVTSSSSSGSSIAGPRQANRSLRGRRPRDLPASRDPGAGSAGISAWLSPAARRDLLHAYQEGNAAIARDFLRRTDGRLFDEPWPKNADGWEPYLGLSPERARTIAMAVHQTILARRLPADHSESESGRGAESASTEAVTGVKPFTAGK